MARGSCLWLVLVLAVIESHSVVSENCPYRCLCFRTTVRCMFLQLEEVPEVPPDTEIIDLRFNKIKEVTANTFKNLKHLNTLLLNNNHITKIEDNAFTGMKELRYLYLYKNRIRTIGQDAFRGLEKLEQLYMHFNEIEAIEPNTFSNLPSLERLFLHNNHLSRIPVGAFRDMKSLRRLRLDSNTLICDCHLLWLSEMLKEKQTTTQAAATCEYPVSLQGKSLTALSFDDFHCKKPQFTEEPTDVDVSFGGTVYFSCKADGDPEPEIVWLHNKNEIIPEEDARLSILNDGTLMITEARDSDQGVYECMAKNAAGEAKSRTAQIRYYGDRVPARFIHRPVDQDVPVGSEVVLSCQATGHPKPDITWTYNNSPLTNSARYHVSTRGTLTISNVQKPDVGTYRCVASNYLGRVSAEAELTVQAPPIFLEKPRNQMVTEGQTIEMKCEVDGFPLPQITWDKDGSPLTVQTGRVEILNDKKLMRITSVKKEDEGVYSCKASNSGGSRVSNADLFVREKAPPVFSRTPQDTEATLGSNIELPCQARGDPEPRITWRKNRIPLNIDSDHYRLSSRGDLYMFNIVQEDQGSYECIAENEVGHAAVSIRLSIRAAPYTTYPGDRYVVPAVENARRAVEEAVNHTLHYLFSRDRNRTPNHLLQVFRFPSPEARDLAKAAEIYEKALLNVRGRVEAGVKLNLTEFRYSEILSPHQMELLTNLSGCQAHRQSPSCSNMCFHRKYRTFDGSCNNLQHSTWGSSLTPFLRLLPAVYENGFNTPVGWTQSQQHHGFPKPSSRLVSTQIISTDVVSPDTEASHMLMQWGQFLDHDIDFSLPAISHESFVDGTDCSRTCDYSPPCFPIEIPPGDRRIRGHSCMEFVRSSAICGSGVTSVFLNEVMPREQANQLTSFIDASNVYGSSERLSQHLRNLTNNLGLLRHGPLMQSGKPLLPFNDGQPIDCQRDPTASHIGCFLAGDIRANEQLGLLSMHTLWMREHNRIAGDLQKLNPHWDGDMLYHEARKLIGAMMQHITYTHWLPNILGPKGMAMLGPYSGYDPTVNPSVSNVFATAAFRFGHSLINPVLLRLNSTFQPIPEGNIELHRAFFAPHRLVEEGGIDPLLRGLFYASAKIKRPDQLLNSQLTEHLFELAHEVALDLAAMNIQRGRDHAIPSYNEWRKFCNLSVAENFDDLKNEIKDQELRTKLQNLYGHPGNVDLWVGGLSEESTEGARIGPTFTCILVDQFKRLRDGDRYWYDNPGVFSPDQLVQVKQTTLARVICDNGDNITHVTRNVFIVPGLQTPQFVECSEIPKVDLRMWSDCCHGCEDSGDFNSVTTLSRRTRRSLEYSYPDEKPLSFRMNKLDNDVVSMTTANATAHAPSTESQNIIQRETDFDATEERIEGLEDLIHTLERTLHKLYRKVSKLQLKSSMTNKRHCTDGLGRRRRNKEHWKDDVCSTCVCKSGQVLCRTRSCPPPTCNNPVIKPDTCCPTC